MATYASLTHLHALYPHLTRRDRQILTLLDRHHVLTTDQIRRLHFQNLRTCQARLGVLAGLDLLDRFRFAFPGGGSEPWHWTLGLAGARFQAATRGQPIPTAPVHRQHVLRLAASPSLRHLLTTNEFFVRLHHHARTDSTCRLDRWWSEKTATAKFLSIHPDGHGIYTHHDRSVGFHLECDRGSESLPRLIAKLRAYAQLIHSGGPRYPVLFWLPSPVREANLQQQLRDVDTTVPVATATHDDDPAGPVWLPAGGNERVHLTDLPCDHGDDNARNPNWRDGQLDLTDQGR